MTKNIFMAFCLVLVVSACGGGSSGTSSGGNDLGDADSLTGTVFAPNGIDPVAGATIYVPSSGGAMIVKTVTGSDGVTTCDDPPETACAETCSLADGTFSLDSSGCASTSSTLKIVKGALVKIASIDCTSDGACAMTASETTFASSDSGTSDIPVMAVVTGNYDAMEDVLAKLGFGSLGTDGRLDISQPFDFTLFNGNYDSNLDAATYQTFDKLLDGTVPMSNYDIIFINCGNSYESMLSDSAVVNRIKDYVTAGGKLYVTDWSYDFIEQSFPEFLRFQDEADDPLTPGVIDDAQEGDENVTVDADVNDDMMKAWLRAVTVNASVLDTTIPGNPSDSGNDCTGNGTYTQLTGALKTDDSIPIGDFLNGWIYIYSTHSGSTALVPTLWTDTGDGSSADFGIDNRPLTASVSYGSNGGKIAYSSYHTAHQCPTQGFWPQERVLQYLIFETF